MADMLLPRVDFFRGHYTVQLYCSRSSWLCMQFLNRSKRCGCACPYQRTCILSVSKDISDACEYGMPSSTHSLSSPGWTSKLFLYYYYNSSQCTPRRGLSMRQTEREQAEDMDHVRNSTRESRPGARPRQSRLILRTRSYLRGVHTAMYVRR